MTPDFTEAAHDLATLGWSVFPLLPKDKKPYPWTCGLHDASDDVGLVVDWWGGRRPLALKEPEKHPGREVRAVPASNIGVATGPASGFFVLDVDGDVGVDSLHRMVKAYAPLPQTVRQTTGKGGHLLYAWPDGVQPRNKAGSLGQTLSGDKPFPGLDVRGDGGYIVAAPSIHPSGRAYGWAEGSGPFDRPLAQAPRWLLALICPPEPAQAPYRREKVSAAGLSAYGRVALQGACDAVGNARPGTQNDTLHRRAFSMGRLVAGGVLPRGEAREALIRAGCAMASGNPRQPWTRQIVEKAVDHAMQRAEGSPNYGPEGRQVRA